MSFGIEGSTPSLSIQVIVHDIIEQLNAHEKKVFSESRTKSNYTDLLMNHPIISAANNSRTTK